MRSSRGYLDTLVRSARPAPVAAGVRAVRQPDWGPARPFEADEPEALEPPRPAPRAQSRTSIPVADVQSPPNHETMAAALPRVVAAAVPPHPVSPVPVAVSRAEPVRAAERPPAPAAVESAPKRRAQPVKVARAVEPLRQAPPPASTPAVAAPPTRLPATTKAALDRLEHLARRLSAALPVEVTRPGPERRPEPEPERRPVAREIVPTPTPLVPTPVAPVPLSRVSERERVEIGSIEVFVTQPRAPAPVPASVTPTRTVVAAPAAAARLSRPLHPFGFGQG